MRILCLSRAPLDYLGGIPAYCLNLYSGGEFDVINYSYDLSKKIKTKNKRLVKGIKEIVFPSQIIIGTFAISIEYILSIVFNKSDYDYVHIQHPDPISALCLIFYKLRKPNLKIVVSWHADIYKSYKLFSPIIFLIDFFLYIISAKLIFFTPFHLRNSFIYKFKFLNKKTKIIHNCIEIKDFNFYKKNKRESIKNKKKINILSIGRLVKYKGYEYAIKALKYTDENVYYTIVGNGPLKSSLLDIVNNLNLNNRVKLIGEVTEKKKYKLLAEADIFLFPSITTSEAYGLVQLEAMAHNIPIINTLLENGVNYLAPTNIAITCKKMNIDEIYKGIMELINNEKKYIKLSENSYHHIKKFDIFEMRKEFINSLKN
tara:strand:- start:467 stop:1582 length:1116 start_codon:yes stop_codon:yes gene_type:complete